ncbi:MAG: 1-acyl-sn-glycerol-3-phosphate acyltransferase [Lachnospiraceae bacterium]|nr:1-acyl-sn-glycerol-3-phosphate acyltransferase [Lachnospiraceae bacterium]
MLRFYFDIITQIPLIIYYIVKIRIMMRHPERYTDECRYGVARGMARCVRRGGNIRTEAFGIENLPKEGGYIMYPNHQGKYDAIGIINSHDAPCSIVIDDIRSRMILTTEFTDVIDGIRLDKTDMKNQVRSIKTLADRVKAGGRYILFPEGGYDHNGNNLQEFMPGAFKAALWSKQPIVPVALIDSYKPFEYNSLKRVTTKVYFLKPIPYEEYGSLSTSEIAERVKGLIAETIAANT